MEDGHTIANSDLLLYMQMKSVSETYNIENGDKDGDGVSLMKLTAVRMRESKLLKEKSVAIG